MMIHKLKILKYEFIKEICINPYYELWFEIGLFAKAFKISLINEKIIQKNFNLVVNFIC